MAEENTNLPHERRMGCGIPLWALAAFVIGVFAFFWFGIQSTPGMGKYGQSRQLISQLDEAIVAFRNCYRTPCPPTTLHLTSNYEAATEGLTRNAKDGQSAPCIACMKKKLEQSERYLKAMFPEWDPSPNREGLPTSNGLPIPEGEIVELQGGQVLVFLLCGYSRHGGGEFDEGALGLGYSKQKEHPFGKPDQVRTDRVERFSPFIEFSRRNLTPLLAPSWNWNQQRIGTFEFLGVTDHDRIPIAYIRSPGHDKLFDAESYCPISFMHQGKRIDWKVQAAFTPDGKFLNVSSFQIIVAGSDGVYAFKEGKFPFGPGGVYKPGEGGYAKGQPGYDDMSNFQGRLLGIP